MGDKVIHPNCIYCVNCERIKSKEGSAIVQDEDKTQHNLCKECYDSLLEEEQN